MFFLSQALGRTATHAIVHARLKVSHAPHRKKASQAKVPKLLRKLINV